VPWPAIKGGPGDGSGCGSGKFVPTLPLQAAQSKAGTIHKMYRRKLYIVRSLRRSVRSAFAVPLTCEPDAGHYGFITNFVAGTSRMQLVSARFNRLKNDAVMA